MGDRLALGRIFSYFLAMSKVDKISIALPSDMLVEIRSAVDAGEYATTSEVIRDALRAWRLKRRVETLEMDELRRMVREGMESGPSIPAADVFAELRARYGK